MAYSHKSEELYNLLSNAQPTIFPTNRANDFVNRVPPLYMPHGDEWEVGLKEFSCVNTLQTIPQDLTYYSTGRQDMEKTKTRRDASRQDIKSKDGGVTCQVCHYILPKGYYNISSLIKALNQNDAAFTFSSIAITDTIVKIKIQTKKDYSLHLSSLLADVLGLSCNISQGSQTIGKFPMNLKAFTYLQHYRLY